MILVLLYWYTVPVGMFERMHDRSPPEYRFVVDVDAVNRESHDSAGLVLQLAQLGGVVKPSVG